MSNQIEREVWVKQDKLKNPIHYVRGTDLLPIVFHFRDFSIPSGATARAFVAKPDGNAVYGSATISGNDVTVDVQQQMFIVLGLSMLQVEIKSGEKTLATFVQPVMVEQNLKAGDLPESTTDVSFLDDAIEQANQAVNTATTAASQAAQAVKNANTAVSNANAAIADLNEQIASLDSNFATLARTVNISQLQTSAKNIVAAVNELNSKAILSAYAPSKPEDNDDISGINIWTASTRKYGRLVNIQFNAHGTIKTTEKFITLYTLNEGYRPITNVIHNYVTQNGTSMILSILPSGEVQVYAFEAITNDWIIRQCITFVCTL